MNNMPGIEKSSADIVHVVPYVAVIGLAVVMGVMIVSHQGLMIAMAIGAFLIIVSIVRITWILYMSIFIVSFTGTVIEFVPKHILYGRTLLPSDILMIPLAVGLFYGVFLRKRMRIMSSGLDPAVALMVLVIVFGFLRGLISGYDAVYRESRGLLYYLLLPLVIMHFKSLSGAEREKQKRTFINFLYICFILVNFSIVLISLDALNLIYHTKKGIAIMDFFRPNKLIDTVFSVPAIFFGILVFYYKRGMGNMILSIACIVMGMAALMVTVTRSFLVSFSIVFLALPFMLRGRGMLSSRIYVLGTVFLLSLFAMNDFVNYKFVEAYRYRFMYSDTISYRVVEAREYFNSFMGSPLLGWGFGAPVNIGLTQTAYSHNEYLYILQTTGVIGFMVFLWFVTKLIATAIRALRASNTPEDIILSSLFAVTLMCFAIISISSPEFRNLSVVPLLVTLAGWIYNVGGKVREGTER